MITFDEGQVAKVKRKHRQKVRDLETVQEGHKEGHGGKKEKKEKRRKHKREKHRQKESEDRTKQLGPEREQTLEVVSGQACVPPPMH